MGSHVASVIAARATGRAPPGPFAYRHQGDFATIGRRAAVVKLVRLELKGALGWWFWGFAHVYYLIGLHNRLIVALQWLWNYMTYQRGAPDRRGHVPTGGGGSRCRDAARARRPAPRDGEPPRGCGLTPRSSRTRRRSLGALARGVL